MDPPTITTQPLRSEEKPIELETLNNGDSKDLLENHVTEKLDDVEAQMDERKRRERDTDCCCAPAPYTDDTDMFCMYIMCRWMCECFAGIGRCTEDCFEGCANCLGECCEGDGCCNCGDAGGGCCDCLAGCEDCCSGCGDCLSGSADCCSACDCST